jgi:hypothetical protein
LKIKEFLDLKFPANFYDTDNQLVKLKNWLILIKRKSFFIKSYIYLDDLNYNPSFVFSKGNNPLIKVSYRLHSENTAITNPEATVNLS